MKTLTAGTVLFSSGFWWKSEKSLFWSRYSLFNYKVVVDPEEELDIRFKFIYPCLMRLFFSSLFGFCFALVAFPSILMNWLSLQRK